MNGDVAVLFAEDSGRFYLSVLPGHIDFKTAAGTKADDTAVLPFFRKGREEGDLGRVISDGTLQKHLADTGRSTEVSVNLEGWMGIEEVGIGAAAVTAVWPFIIVRTDVGEQFLIDMISLFCITKSCPEVDAPSCAPPSGLVPFLDECLFAGS